MEYTVQRLLTLLRVLLFMVGVGLVVWGQTHIGYPGLSAMLLGLALILGLIYEYNRRNK